MTNTEPAILNTITIVTESSNALVVFAIVQGVFIVLIGIITTWIALQQKEINKQRLNVELYDRRINIYRKVISVLKMSIGGGKINYNDAIQFYSDTREAVFLFDKVTYDFISELHNKTLRLAHLTMITSGKQPLPEGEERSKALQELYSILEWLEEQIRSVDDVFKKYFSF